jgi:uncharacterized protein with ATP-grasp and redox domains
MAGLGEAVERKAVEEAAKAVRESDLTLPPAIVATRAMRAAAHLWEGTDPFLQMKIKTTEEALAMYDAIKPDMGERLGRMTPVERVRLCAKLAAAGNIIDFGVGTEFDLEKTLRETLESPLAIDESEAFYRALASARSLLIISDNAGEIVFDRFLMDEALALGKSVWLSVKSGPMINDAMREDAVRAGIPESVRVIETGSSSLGIVFEECSEEFRGAFRGAGVVLSKGQANYETLDESPKRIFFILRAKCPLVARGLGVPTGGSVLSVGGPHDSR